MTPGQRLTVEHSAEGMSGMVALVTAWRGGMDPAEFGDLVAQTVRDIEARPGSRGRICWLITQLAAGQADLCERWNEAAGGTPADEWLAELARVAALDLADLLAVPEAGV